MWMSRRARRGLFERVIIAIYDGGERASKRPLFTADERLALAAEAVAPVAQYHR